MAGASIRQIGDFAHVSKFLSRVNKRNFNDKIEQYAQLGCSALAAATPIRTGKTAASWSYEIENEGSVTRLTWINTNTNHHISIAYILDKGHGTGTGGWVPGLNFIEPALQPVIDAMIKDQWKEVTSS